MQAPRLKWPTMNSQQLCYWILEEKMACWWWDHLQDPHDSWWNRVRWSTVEVYWVWWLNPWKARCPRRLSLHHRRHRRMSWIDLAVNRQAISLMTLSFWGPRVWWFDHMLGHAIGKRQKCAICINHVNLLFDTSKETYCRCISSNKDAVWNNFSCHSLFHSSDFREIDYKLSNKSKSAHRFCMIDERKRLTLVTHPKMFDLKQTWFSDT